MTDTRARLLDAAAEVLIRDGAGGLTLTAVAEQAGVSKGGLLYHFPSKEALADGMVRQFVEQFDAALQQAGDDKGAATRAYLDATIAERPNAAGAAGDRTTVALFAAALVEPDTLQPLRDLYRGWQRRLENDGIDPAVATAVRMAVDGWWLARLIDLAPPRGRLHRQVHRVLTGLIEEG